MRTLLPYRPRQDPDRRRQALPLRGDRQDQQTCLGAGGPQDWAEFSLSLSHGLDHGRAIPDLHCPHRQRDPGHIPAPLDGHMARYVIHMSDMRCQVIRHRASPDEGEASLDQCLVERMNRAIKEATFKRFNNAEHQQFEMHLTQFIGAYNLLGASRPSEVSPYELICNAGPRSPDASGSIQPIKRRDKSQSGCCPD